MTKDNYDVISEIYPQWISDFDSSVLDKDKQFNKILRFYVFQCPFSKDYSYQSINLSRYGWINPWKKQNYLKKLLDKNVFSNHKIQFIKSKSKKDFYQICKSASFGYNFFKDISSERAAIFSSDGKNKYELLLFSIRCAFAHGRVLEVKDDLGNIYYVLENGKPSTDKKNFIVSARIVLKKKTLIRWIKIIEQGPKEAVLYKKIYKIIRDNSGVINKKKVSKILKVNISSVSYGFNYLKNKKIIEYDKTNRYWNYNDHLFNILVNK